MTLGLSGGREEAAEDLDRVSQATWVPFAPDEAVRGAKSAATRSVRPARISNRLAVRFRSTGLERSICLPVKLLIMMPELIVATLVAVFRVSTASA